MKGIILFFISVYQKFFSPLLPKSCRFYPSCSNYMIQAINKFGLFKGLHLGIKRILRCHPFTKGGYDPIP